VIAARLEAPRAGVRPVTVTAPARRAGLAWPRLPAVATIGTGYLGYALVRLAIHANRHAAFAYAAQLWQAERRMRARIEPWLNGLAAARPHTRRGGRLISGGIAAGHQVPGWGWWPARSPRLRRRGGAADADEQGIRPQSRQLAAVPGARGDCPEAVIGH